MVHRLVLPERPFPRRCARRDEWGRIFGDWVPVTRSGPGRLFTSANRGLARIQKNRVVIIGSAVSARDSPDNTAKGTERTSFEAKRRSIRLRKYPTIAYLKLNKTSRAITINDSKIRNLLRDAE